MQYAHIKSVGPKGPGKDKKEDQGNGLESISAETWGLCPSVYYYAEKAQFRFTESSQGTVDKWF